MLEGMGYRAGQVGVRGALISKEKGKGRGPAGFMAHV